MPIARLKTVTRELQLAVSSDLSPMARQRFIAATARRDLARIAETNRRLVGDAAPPDVFVDGRGGAPLESVNPNHGVILGVFALTYEVLEWIDAMLILHSPVRTGRYARSHKLFADGVEVDPEKPPKASSYTFLSDVPYARKIERGLSKMAPDGVYEVTAALTNRRFGNIVRAMFTYESPTAGRVVKWAAGTGMRGPRPSLNRKGPQRTAWLTRQPAIVVEPR